MLGLRAKIYLPDDLSEPRIAAIAAEGAAIARVRGTYDDAVVAAAEDARDAGHLLVSDTSTGEDDSSARAVIDGYGTIFEEIDDELRSRGEDAAAAVDLISVPAGVGALGRVQLPAAAALAPQPRARRRRTAL